MPPSRLLPDDHRSPLRAAPTTSVWWHAFVVTRGWLGRHRHRWLAPALVCAPPVGIAMLWAGATRPGEHRRWVTAGAVAWMLALVVVLLSVSLPAAQPGEAVAAVALGDLSTGPAPTSSAGSTPSGSTTPSGDGTSTGAATAGSTAVGGAGSGAGSSGSGAGVPGAGTVPSSTAAGGGAHPTSSAPTASRPSQPVAATPTRTRQPSTPTPTPTRPPTRPTNSAPPSSPGLPHATPLTSCTREGAQALSPLGLLLRCEQTPLGLFWLWSQ